MKLVSAALAGLLFAFGLALGGMTDPRKVIGFLDVTGEWDPSLAFVMGGAILVYGPAARWLRRHEAPRFDTAFHLPPREPIDARLVLGAVIFGLGWGLSGFCPGPAVVATMSLRTPALLFAGSMLVGMVAFALSERRTPPR